jgi:glycosyltransferase involved in cell wall biosynthesis
VTLVFVTQAIDADHPNLAATIDMVRALAARTDGVVVVTDRVLRHDLPANVTFRTFGAATRAGRTVGYLRAVGGALRTKPDALIAHMVPFYVVLAAPFARPRGIPMLLWYTHWRSDWSLRTATRLCAVALTVDKASYPVDSPKVRAIGHGIDLSRFPPRGGDRPSGPLQLVALGRTQPWKGLPTLLAGFEQAVAQGLDAQLRIRGPQLTDEERAHRAELEATIAGSAALREHASVEDAVSRDEIPALLRSADALVSAAEGRHGSEALDKVVYEASAAAVPVIASSPALRDYLGGLPVELRFRPGDPADLAARLVAFGAADPAARAETGRELRRRVEAGHSVEAWADAVVAVVREARG